MEFYNLKCINKYNMKKILLLVLLLFSFKFSDAQITKWAIQPNFDRIYIISGAPLIISDSASVSTIWDFNGNKLSVTKDSIHTFHEGYAVTTSREDGSITGYYDTNANFTSLKQSDLSIAYGYPYFSDGYLLAKIGNLFRFISTKGELMDFGLYKEAFPFNKKHAALFKFELMDKLKNPHYKYINTDNTEVQFFLNKKVVDTLSVNFLSSISDDGKGIAVIKEKVYIFDVDSSKLHPLFFNENEVNVKKQVCVSEPVSTSLFNYEGKFLLKAKSGKEDKVNIYFDYLMKPERIEFVGNRDIYFQKEQDELREYSSALVSFKGQDGKFGFKYNGKIVLPPQFQNVDFCMNDYAVVCKDNKWGMLYHINDLSYTTRINKGDVIGFRHKHFETLVRLDLPAEISSTPCKFDIQEGSGCLLDKTSCEKKDTESGNFIQYDCVLSIPSDLPDTERKEISYPLVVSYDGIVYPTDTLKTKAWHLKYMNVNINDQEKEIVNGNVSFTIDITGKEAGDGDYPFEVSIASDSLVVSIEKISETRYKCKLDSLAEGLNNVYISILEDGCPPSVTPLEITYIKPVKKTRNTPEVKEDVIIQRKTRSGANKTSVPRIEI